MKKIEQLLIRACKSKNYRQRLKSTYKRFYTPIEGQFETNITMILAHLVDDYFPIKSVNYISKRAESKLWYGDTTDLWYHSAYPLIQHIRWMDGEKLLNLGYKTPRAFKKLAKED